MTDTHKSVPRTPHNVQQAATTTEPVVKRALISVTDKAGIVDFARALQDEFAVEIVSTGGTARQLADAGIKVRTINELTGFPEMMDGRIKTLHPKVHGAILARRDLSTHLGQAKQYGIGLIDMVVVNLYAFAATVAKPDVTYAEAIENIDIGGPALLRSAAKNHAAVTVVCNPADYESVLLELRLHAGATTLATRRRLATTVFAATSAYDNAIYTWMYDQLAIENNHFNQEAAASATEPVGRQDTLSSSAATPDLAGSPSEDSPPTISATPDLASSYETPGCPVCGQTESLTQWGVFAIDKRLFLCKQQELRYGENPHQPAAFYRYAPGLDAAMLPPTLRANAALPSPNPAWQLGQAQQLQGKELSYNNYLDLDAAWAAVREFSEPCCVIIKHLTPCGIACAPTPALAYEAAFACDPISAFGGVMAFNRPLDTAVVEAIFERGQFVEALVVPHIELTALALLSQKTNLRVLETGGINPTGNQLEFRSVEGGLLAMVSDSVREDSHTFEVVSQRQPSSEEAQALLFAWRACKSVKSNAILIAQGSVTVGIGCGQPNRLRSAELAVAQAGDKARGAVAASDAFMPFADSLEVLAGSGVTALIQPGGSIRDNEVLLAANDADMAVVFTGLRHFRH
ncbi:MAG: bifunctional phosphoribosylaminoimidazolecarboxamide formyltransferase/inosine monophosphate cyclohydrolase [Coriobacteriales bacterium]|nr:bifunctional phosphoribosylaminoimidazolecarboxamide formyltransferase/inosine monophosphate cyclohydrolase [Coriobacteriales bacterium]